MQHISTIIPNVEAAARAADTPLYSRPVTQYGQRIDAYADRPLIGQLDCQHPGMQRAVNAVYQWRERYKAACDPANAEPPRSPSLVLSGPNGTGKTHIARALYWSVVSAPMSFMDERPDMAAARPIARWFDAPGLIMKLAAYQTEYHTVEYNSVGQLIGSAPFVIVDDLGGEGTIPFVAAAEQSFERQARWFRFIDFCYDRQVPVIITTNLDIQNGSLAEWIGRRAWDRLNEMAPVGQMVGLWDVPSWRVKTGGR